MSALEITLVQIERPVIVRGHRTIALPIALWLSAGFWDLFDLPDIDSVLAALTFGTEDSPRTYLAGHTDDPARWSTTPWTVDVPATFGAGPGVLEVSGPMTDELRLTAQRIGLVIVFAAPGVHRIHPVEMWETNRWHTVVLVPRDK
jgi:hypothetical protein